MQNSMVLKGVIDLNKNPEPLERVDMRVGEPDAGQVLLKVKACGVCHTELDEIEGRTRPPSYPIVPGHQVVGIVESCGAGVADEHMGTRRGVAWIYSACGACEYCLSGHENLCPGFRATGRDADGGYAERMLAPFAFTYSIPDAYSDAEAAPLLCGGAIGYRALRLTHLANGAVLGLTGFGASAHQVLRVSKYLFPDSPVFVFARSGADREFARALGADWAGSTDDAPPEPCAAIIDTTPAWKPVVAALEHLRPGGRLVINAIRKEAGDSSLLATIRYERHLWMEKEVKSVANITRGDVSGFLELAVRIGLKPEVECYPLMEANRALLDVRNGRTKGAAVLVMS